uniref:Inosine triphosphate pyrophosphatase n=1 Tax=Arcella intermedia TaxID=1963864 RepID=A0A6B2LIC9_9EUKA
MTFVTGNAGKLREVTTLLNAHLTVGSGEAEEGLQEHEDYIGMVKEGLDLPELQGDPKTISVEKCRAASKLIAGPVVVEDTGLCCNALGGLPGPYIRWFLQGCGAEGVHKMLQGFGDYSAYAETIFSFTSGPGEEIHTFVGRTQGRIVPPRGISSFGAVSWDPVFEPEEGGGKTYAEMTKEDKNKISQRGRAIQQLRTFLLQNKTLWK